MQTYLRSHTTNLYSLALGKGLLAKFEQPTMPTIALVVLNYNGQHLLAQFLPHLLRHSPIHSIIVADNASQDDSVAFLKAHYPHVQCMALAQNMGFAKAYNQVLQKIRATYYVLLNTDVEVTPGWLPPLIQLMEQHPHIGACQPKVLAYDKRHLFEYAGAGGGYIDRWGYPFCRGRLFGTLEADRGQYDDTIPIFWASGACFCVRSHVFHTLGGFDERFFAHYEEIDLCWRMQRHGFAVYHCGKSQVYHMGGATIRPDSPEKVYLNFRNRALTYYKNSPPQGFWQQLCYKALDVLAAIRACLVGKPKHAWAIVRALRDFHKMRKYYPRPQPYPWPMQHMYKGCLPWAYFVRGKRTWASLSPVDQGLAPWP
ncbi:MAG: glycosyltransferase family 2 protein [Bacteroidota bacterium]